MTASVITVIAVVAGIAWLAMMGVSAIRNRGSEEIAPNLAPGLTNAELETKRLETGQKAAIAFSAFLAISLPLYFLGELDRQESFVEEFATESIDRGAHLVEEFACFSCHGPEGVGGSASFVEKRSGVTVSWEAPALNDILYRYDRDELNFWITFGRGNTPMPAWGLEGGGPLNEAQVEDVVNYLATIQVPQAEVLEKLDPAISVQLDRLANADATVASAILNQDQVVADIRSAPEEFAEFGPLADRADLILEEAETGIDTDGDGLSDSAEVELSELTVEAAAIFAVVDAITMDPEVADAELATEAVAQLEAGLERDPILRVNLDAVQVAIIEGTIDPATGLTASGQETLEAILGEAGGLGVANLPTSLETAEDVEGMLTALEDAAAAEGADPAVVTLSTDAQAAVAESSDPDGDGISSSAEDTVSAQMADAASKTIPPQIAVVELDPTNPASVGGQPDETTARTVVGNLDSLRISLQVTTENNAKLLDAEKEGLAFLQDAQAAMEWAIDMEGVAEAMGVSVAEAERAVGIYNASCARCHTAGFTAGVPYTQEVGSGGFGPALWDGRPVVQFGDAAELPEDDLLVQFLVKGSEAETPYGLNGFGSGRMPGFGAILSLEDIELLAKYLRSGNLNGME